MKTLILSDTHLTAHFDKRRFEYLKKLIQQADRVIINGDFIDLYASRFPQFLNSQWQELFPYLKEKETIFIYGNHDPQKWIDERVSHFSHMQADNFTMPWRDHVLYISHGHEVIPSVGDYFPWLARRKYLGKLGIYRDQLGTFVRGKRFLERYKRLNQRLKEWSKEHLPDDHIYVSGHTHLLEKDLENRFVNSGFIRHGFGQYVVIDGDDLRIVDERY